MAKKESPLSVVPVVLSYPLVPLTLLNGLLLVGHHPSEELGLSGAVLGGAVVAFSAMGVVFLSDSDEKGDAAVTLGIGAVATAVGMLSFRAAQRSERDDRAGPRVGATLTRGTDGDLVPGVSLSLHF